LNPLRVLILADECNPEWPSLPLVGYNTCLALSQRLDLVIATHVRNKENLSRSGIPRADVVFLDNEYVARPMYKAATFLRGGGSVNWTTNVAMAYLPYLCFEREVWKRFGGDLRSGRFDLVHRVTPMSPTLPSPLASWSPVPFVIGPLNGGLPWPEQFQSELHREREWLTHLRSAHRALPYYRSTYCRAAAILAAFSHTIRDLPSDAMDRVVAFPEVGIDPDRFAAGERPPGNQITFFFAGRLVPYKCPDVAVAAFAAAPELRCHRLVVVGDGPERPRLEAMIEEHDLQGCVDLAGWLPQQDVAKRMTQADVFVFPSIRELGAGVVVEAMASGLACVVVDYGGPGSLIDTGRGIKVPLGDKKQLVADFTRALVGLATDPSRRHCLAEEARRYALREYSWSAKAAKLESVYRWVLGERRDRPSFEESAEPSM